MNPSRLLVVLIPAFLAGCAVPSTPQQPVEPPVSRTQQIDAQKLALQPAAKALKRKVAIGRFSNETRYGRTLQTDASLDPLGKQASDMLSSRLVSSQKFLVFERPDISKIQAEQAILKDGGLVGVDALLLGSVTEFGRSTSGQSGFLSATKVQTARAKVEIRLVDPKTGLAFFAATGTGEASTESGSVAGFGSKADYDGSLNDRAIAAAISDVQNALISKLEERPWRTDILRVAGKQIFISGGTKQGLKVGDNLAILRQGETVKSAQTGFAITLPATPVGKARVVSLFGDSESNEGAVAEVTSGAVSAADLSSVFISEWKE
nr:CsgG/HfaB family protein [Xylophilus sp. ASV27]